MVLTLEDSLSFLRCSACNETYKQPHILPCLHSYCFGCIEKFKRCSGEETYLKCPRCEQGSKFSEDTVRPNNFFVNSLAASRLKEIREHGIDCGNCKKDETSPTVFCQECDEHLCSDCVYCHQNTKLTRTHSLVPKDDYVKRLSVFGHDRAVFCRRHSERKVEQYCCSCHETICPGCDFHGDHNVLSLADAYSIETPVLKELLLKATAKVESNEKSAARYCCITDELRERKGEVSDQIRSYFAERRERMEKDEEKLLEMVLSWYDKNFQIIKNAQKEEELQIEKVTNALNLSQIVLKHGTDVEILSMKNLIQSQLSQVVEYTKGEKLLAVVEVAIRNASWDLLPEHQKQHNCLQEGLKLPEVEEPQEQKDEVTSSEHEEWEVINDKSVPISEEKEWNDGKHLRGAWFQLKNVDKAVRSFGLEGRDYHVGSAGKKKVWQRLRNVLGGGGEEGMEEKEEFERDYRYDTILRTKIIGQQGSDCGEFQHPCDIVVDYERHDRLIVTDYNNNRVQVFNYLGSYLFEFGSRGDKPGQFMGPTGVAVLRDGSTVVCDCLNNRVQIFTQEGYYSSTFGKEGRGQGEFWRPMGVAVDSENRIIVVDQGNNRVQVFDRNGDFCLSFGKLGNWDGEVSCPNFVAVDKHDNIYVSDEVNMRIQIFNRHGTYLRKVTSQEIHGFRGNMELLSGIAVDPRGHIVVGAKSSCTVGIFTPDGRFLRTFSSKRTNQSRVQFSTGIALTSGGEIAVCDWFNNKIRFF